MLNNSLFFIIIYCAIHEKQTKTDTIPQKI